MATGWLWCTDEAWRRWRWHPAEPFCSRNAVLLFVGHAGGRTWAGGSARRAPWCRGAPRWAGLPVAVAGTPGLRVSGCVSELDAQGAPLAGVSRAAIVALAAGLALLAVAYRPALIRCSRGGEPPVL